MIVVNDIGRINYSALVTYLIVLCGFLFSLWMVII